QFVVRYLRRPQFVSLIIRAYYRCGPDLCNKAFMGVCALVWGQIIGRGNRK
ncbi:hypothetical protein HNP33_002799, partial [Comamonas odontotermitis]|nr:hypothetical protein [Comamonas odontotermitis]